MVRAPDHGQRRPGRDRRLLRHPARRRRRARRRPRHRPDRPPPGLRRLRPRLRRLGRRDPAAALRGPAGVLDAVRADGRRRPRTHPGPDRPLRPAAQPRRTRRHHRHPGGEPLRRGFARGPDARGRGGRRTDRGVRGRDRPAARCGHLRGVGAAGHRVPARHTRRRAATRFREGLVGGLPGRTGRGLGLPDPLAAADGHHPDGDDDQRPRPGLVLGAAARARPRGPRRGHRARPAGLPVRRLRPARRADVRGVGRAFPRRAVFARPSSPPGPPATWSPPSPTPPCRSP